MLRSLRFAIPVFFSFAPIAVLADSTTTLPNNTRFSFDSGSTVASGGDVLWNSGTLTPQAPAGVAWLGASPLASLSYTNIISFSTAATYGPAAAGTPLSGSLISVGTVLVVHTVAGSYAKVMVTSMSGGALGIQYVTYTSSGGGGGGGGGTTGNLIAENAATNIFPGLPNGAIAQGALFVVKGNNLGPANVVVATSFPLQTSIGGTSMQVTVGSTTVDAIMYYSLATQVAAILPSRTPTGSGTVKVTFNGQSQTGAITVVTSNIGVFTLNTTGSGDAVATLPATNTVVSPTNAPNPGETVTLWATGLGPVTFDETQPAQQSDMASITLRVFIGGQQATVLFRGRNACCSGVDTIYVTVPQGLTGCANSVIIQIGDIVSNATTIPIGTNGRSCVPIAPNQTGGGLGSGTHSFGGLSLAREGIDTAAIGPSPAMSQKLDLIGGIFEKVTYSTPPQGSQVDVTSYGSCVVSTLVSGQRATSPGSVQFLDAGNITVSGPGIAGSRQIGKTTAGGTLIYTLQLDNTATTLAAGTYTFMGSGGLDVGPFTASYTMPPPFAWTNQSSLSTVVRANGVTVTWTGGDPAGYVQITGMSTLYGATAATTVSVSFACTARVSDGSFIVPPVVLLSLPPTAPAPGGSFTTPGTLGVTSVASNATGFQASGIEFGGVGSTFVYINSAMYQ